MNAPVEALARPPFAPEAEQSVIGGLLLTPDALDRIDWLDPSSFYMETHRAIFAAQRKLIESNKPADYGAVCAHLRDHGELERVGGTEYVASLALDCPSAASIHHYARTIVDKAILRKLVAIGRDIAERGMNPLLKPQEVLEEAEASISDLASGHVKESEAVDFHESITAAMQQRDQSHTGLPTGLKDLDKIVRPMRGGDLIIIAGRPSMGKSGLASNIAEFNAMDRHVGVWSLEMSRADWADRIIKWHERNDENAPVRLAGLKLYIDAPYTLSIASLRLRMKRLRRRRGLDLAVIDYLQLMRGTGENRAQEIGSISRGLKQLAVEMDIPIIAVCQINRGVEQRTDKRPMLSDLRESGDIEQDADIAIMVYRDEYYHQNSTAAGTAELLVRKQRNGGVGTARATFLANFPRFVNYAGPDISEQVPPSRRISNFDDYKSRAAGSD